MHNGGGTMTTDYARGHAVKTLNSGPAAGVMAGAAIAAASGRRDAVCIDMGGTTCEFRSRRPRHGTLLIVAHLREGCPRLARYVKARTQEVQIVDP